jgi:hypothetical protein
MYDLHNNTLTAIIAVEGGTQSKRAVLATYCVSSMCPSFFALSREASAETMASSPPAAPLPYFFILELVISFIYFK